MLAKSKLNSMDVLISKVLIDSVISNDEFVSINVLKQYNEMKKGIKNLMNQSSFGLIEDFSLFIKQCYHIII